MGLKRGSDKNVIRSKSGKIKYILALQPKYASKAGTEKCSENRQTNCVTTTKSVGDHPKQGTSEKKTNEETAVGKMNICAIRFHTESIVVGQN